MIIAAATFIIGVGNPVFAAEKGSSMFTLEGAVSGSFKDARCSLVYNKYGKVWMLRLTPKDGRSPAANLFFSPKFGNAKAGKYPVKFSYRGAAATMGGSVTEGRTMYSHDTDGTVDFSRFDDRVEGSFSYTSKSRSGDSVLASGSFDCSRGEALR